ncbi:MAG: 4a-hydroxytetrahydrobiopterin dehydratase [Acidobacteriia bacterium]|nr:4a-hydroxytetrahydrobiopterin dehydratase [Terriglobia bacterium]
MAKLSSSEIEDQLKALPGWKLMEGQLVKEFEFPSFPDLISFLVKVGFLAESADHHPDMDIRYRRLTVRASTHSENGITEKDFQLIKQIEAAISLR